ncbi:MAG: fibrobacter succinogenes major paralogous domain-containing protein, partial [Fibrobacter sp.]|nr:fibrobacter succinogenes major paralogous domain-containing protein [Fibrobacter sp.]
NGKYYFVQHQGICPEGWHIMNENEWVEISEKSSRDVALYMGSKVAGFGSNSYGLSILPAGEWNSLENRFEVIAEFAIYWTSQQHLEYEDCAYAAMITTNEFNRSSRSGKGQGLSVRCVKNY